MNNPDFTRTFVLQTDASDYGIGAVLSHIDDTGLEHPVAFYREQRYATVEKECLAIRCPSIQEVCGTDRSPCPHMVTLTKR